MFDDFLPVEMPVLGIDDDPVEAQCHGHFRDTGALECDPQPIDRFLFGEFGAEGPNGAGVHSAILSGQATRSIRARKTTPLQGVPPLMSDGAAVVELCRTSLPFLFLIA